MNNYCRELIIENLLLKDIDLIILDEVESTNTFAKELVTNKAPFPTIVLAESQTSAKGRLGKSFYCEKSSGIYMTILLKTSELIKYDELTIRAATATAKSLTKFTQSTIKIKWVNDLFYKNRKVAGILTESTNNENWYVIGIGINLNINNFPCELSSIASSITTNVPRELILANIINNLLVQPKPFGRILTFYKDLCFILGKEIHFTHNNRHLTGIAYDIDIHGQLVVKCSTKTYLLNSGEIELISKNFTC